MYLVCGNSHQKNRGKKSQCAGRRRWPARRRREPPRFATGVAAGVLVLDEPFSVRLILGGLVVVLGVALVQGRLLRARTPAPERVPEPAARD
jgi:hypothetical protein